MLEGEGKFENLDKFLKKIKEIDKNIDCNADLMSNY